MTIRLNGSDLTVTQVIAAARHGEPVALAAEAITAMRQSRTVVEEVLSKSEPVYGLTTGVGERKAFLLDPAQRQRFNHRLVLNHRIAQGDAAPPDVVRGAMLCLASSYAKGVTGVRPELCEMIITLLNEGFALVSSNAFTTAWACIATADADVLMSVFDVAGALDLEAFGANLTCLHPIIEQTRPFPGLAATLGQLRALLAGSYLWQPGAARFLQDPLTFRCIPHIHGAARDALAYARRILQLELNSSQSNPVVVVPERRIVSVGNFDIGPLAAALDFARIALAPVVTITVEARTLAHPVSYELASSVKGEGIEDRATMAPLSARRLADMIQLCARVAAIEFVVAAQAIDLRERPGLTGAAPGQLGLGTGRAYRMIRELIPFTQGDGTLPADLEPLVALVTTGNLNPPAAVA